MFFYLQCFNIKSSLQEVQFAKEFNISAQLFKAWLA